MPDFDPDLPGALLGLGMGWPPREDPLTGDFVRVADERSVSESILHLIHTTPGVIPGAEDQGTEVESLLFSASNFDALSKIVGESIVTAIRTYEKRVHVIDAAFTAREASGGRLVCYARIRYRIRATGEIVDGVFPFNLDVR